MTTLTSVTLGCPQRPLQLADLAHLSEAETRLKLDPSTEQRTRPSRLLVEKVQAEERVVYGVNTGFGRLSSVRISTDQLEALQRNLVRSHSAGTGEPLPASTVRVLMALRLNSLLGGYSGVTQQLLRSLCDLYNSGVIPYVPSRGSVGASGDLAPLSHVALCLMGEGEAYYQGVLMAGSEALAAAGLRPYVFQAKEALACINGTQLMTAVGGLALGRARLLLKAADIIAAMSVEALLGTDSAFHASIHRVRPHPGQIASAANLTRCMKGSALVASHKGCPKVQDPYSLRCAPQVHGASRDGIAFSVQILEREINAVTDNPLVFPDEDLILSGGNFHGAPVALALDSAAISLSYLGTISERRCDRLLNPDSSELPPFLTPHQGLHSGLMLVQYVAAALASENKIYCHPASSDSIPTSAGHEDHVSMGPSAAYKLEKLVENIEQILACEWVCATQALDFRRPLTFGPGTETAHTVLRQHVPPWGDDHPPYRELEAAREALPQLVEQVEQKIGPLE
ncbi:histidine ammonia-lyase [bacterium]|nr:histidine ammonia-lyase [bacterium]